MTIFTFANLINTKLAAPISSSATSLTLASAANLPASIPSGQSLVLVLNDAATRQVYEIIYATSISGATLSGLSRGQESTAALSWDTGDFAYSPPTSGQMSAFPQLPANNSFSGNNSFTNGVSAPQIFSSSGYFVISSNTGINCTDISETAHVPVLCSAVVDEIDSQLLLMNNGAINCTNVAGNAQVPLRCAPGTTSTEAVILAQFAGAQSSSGYNVFPSLNSPSGYIIIQWSSVEISSANTYQTLTMPTPWLTGPLSAVGSCSSINSYGGVTVSGGLVRAWANNAGAVFSYIAIGY